MLARMSARLSKWIERLIEVFEIILSILLIAGVVSAGLVMVLSLRGVFMSQTNTSLQNFLDNALLYIIGLEVALMLVKRDPHLVTDILIFAIARKMIVTMQSGVDFFFGALAILVLYLVKAFGISRLHESPGWWSTIRGRGTESSARRGESGSEKSTNS